MPHSPTFGRFLSPGKLIHKRLTDPGQAILPPGSLPESASLSTLASAHYDEAFIEAAAATS